MRNYWTATAATLLAIGVMLGAFGAHALRSRLDPYLMTVWERAVFYHFAHSLGLLVVAQFGRIGALPPKRLHLVCALLAAGVFLFSGSLYALCLTGVRALGIITPAGGLSFIAAWLVLAWSVLAVGD